MKRSAKRFQKYKKPFKQRLLERKKRSYLYLHRLYTNQNLRYLNHTFRVTKQYTTQIDITIKPNNIFCLVRDRKKNKIIKKTSTGCNKLKTTKKRLKFQFNKIIFIFYKQIRKYLKHKKQLLIHIRTPKNLKKKFTRKVRRTFRIYKKYRTHIICINFFKCFNGCKSPKRIIKKKRKPRYI